MTEQHPASPPPAGGAWGPAAGPPRPPRLTRRQDGRVVAGVCNGLGDYFGVDPVAFRVAFIALTLAGGAGVLLYGLAWILVPSTGQGRPASPSLMERRDLRAILGIALLIIAVTIVAGEVELLRPGIVWAVVLIGLGVWLFRQDLSPAAAPGEERQAQAPGGPPPAGQPPAGALPVGQPAATGGWPPPPPPPSPPPRWGPPALPQRPRSSRVGRLTLGAALVVTGATAVLALTGAVGLSVAQALALGLVVVGGGLLVGAWQGRRAPGLLLLGMLLIPTIALASVPERVGDVSFGDAGSQRWVPGTVADIHPSYQLSVGELTIDLSRTPLAGEEATVNAQLGFGDLAVVVPEGATVHVAAKNGAGDIRIAGAQDRDGFGLAVEETLPGRPGGGRLDLDLTLGAGDLVVRRGS